MIRADVTVTGKITRNPVVKKDRQGNEMATFHVRTGLPSHTGDQTDIDIYITAPLPSTPLSQTYKVGQTVQVRGVMDIVIKTDGVNPKYKNNPVLLYFLAADEIEIQEQPQEDTITGTMEFRGKMIGRADTRQNERGAEYLQFIGIIYARDQTTNTFFRQNVRFIKYRAPKETREQYRPSWLVNQQNITVNGRMSLTSHNGAVTIGCLVDTLAKYTSSTKQ